MQEVLLFCFNLKKSTAKSYRMLMEAYGDSGLSETTCRDWFRRFKDGNFNLSDKKREDDTQSQKMLAEQLGDTQTAISMHLRTI